MNLLQPQDRRSRRPGDPPEALAARHRIHHRGLTAPLLNAISDFVAPSPDDLGLDLGCGDGFYLGSLAQLHGLQGYGIDISTAAIDLAARRYPACHWIVANADRFIPYANSQFSLVLSITGRMNPAEKARVLRPDGQLLIAVPAPDDLIELRGPGRDRTARTVEDFSPAFTLSARRRATTIAEIDSSAVDDFLLSIYRPLQRTPIHATRLTLSLDLLLFRKTAAATPLS